MYRLLKLFLFIGAIVALGLMFTLPSLTVGDIFASLLAFRILKKKNLGDVISANKYL